MIKVGAATETEMKEKKARVEDAMHATKAAVEEGIVPGGGVALLRCAEAPSTAVKAEGDEAVGVSIIRRALEEPLRQIADNAGHEGAVVVAQGPGDEGRRGLQRADRDATRTWSRRASSTRPRSSAPRCRTPPPSPRCCSPPRPSICEIPEEKSEGGMPAACRAAAAGCTDAATTRAPRRVEGQPKSAALRFWGTSNGREPLIAVGRKRPPEDVGTRSPREAGKPRAPLPERAKTDDSLRAERLDTDGALKGDVASAERDADDVVDRAREVADAVLSDARLKADQESLRTPRPAEADAVVDERAKADHVVRVERAAADVALDSDRKEQADTLATLLVHERAATDAYLLTERDRADDAVAHRDDFLGMVAHDVRNLLNGVVLSLELLRPGDDEPAPHVAAAATRIRRYVARMNRLIGDLVDVTSIDAVFVACDFGLDQQALPQVPGRDADRIEGLDHLQYQWRIFRVQLGLGGQVFDGQIGRARAIGALDAHQIQIALFV